MATPEANVETIVLAIIDAVLPTVETRGQDEDSSTVSVPNRIIVDVAPKTPMLSARKDTLLPVVWQSVVTVKAQSNTGASTFDAWKDAIDDAICPATNAYPTAIVTLAQSLMSTGLEFFPLDGGEQANGDQRVYTRTFRAMFQS